MEPIESSETSAYNNTLTPETYPKEKKLLSKHGESLKSRKHYITLHYITSSTQCPCAILSSVCAPLSNIFPHYLINGTVLAKQLLCIKYVFRVSLQILYETLFILRRSERDMIGNVYWSSCKLPFILLRF